MPRKTIPAEAQIDLTRRLVVLPPRSHERRLIIAESAQVFGVSEPTLYRALRTARKRDAVVQAEASLWFRCRDRLIRASAASSANRRCSSGGTLKVRLPE